MGRGIVSAFGRKLHSLFTEAESAGIITSEQTQKLYDLAEQRKAARIDISAVLLALGSLIVIAGCILLIAANWQQLPAVCKFTLFFVLFAGIHGCGLWLRLRKRPLPRTAEVLNFIGMGLFLGGVGLVAQVYHLDNHAPNAILLWLVATLPLMVLLRSPSLTGMAVFALLVWLHMEGSADDSPVHIPESYSLWMVLEAGTGISLIIAAQLLEVRSYATAMVLRAFGMLPFLVALYSLTFFRHYGKPDTYSSHHHNIWGSALTLPAAVAGVVIALIVFLAVRSISQYRPGWRSQAGIYLLTLLATIYAALTANQGLYEGDPLNWMAQCCGVSPYLLFTLFIWLLWFWGSFWLIADGARLARRGTIALGAAGIVVGIITIFFDLIHTQGITGMIFFAAGLLLLGITGWRVCKCQKRQ